MTYLGPAGIFSTGDAAADQRQIECEQGGPEEDSEDSDTSFLAGKCPQCGYHGQEEYWRESLQARQQAEEILKKEHGSMNHSCKGTVSFC